MNLGLPIDWAATGQMLTGWGTLAGAFAVMFAAIRGVSKFDDWKKQRVEGRRMSLAEKLLEAIYEFERSLSQVRSPIHGGGELERAREKLAEDDPGFAGLAEHKQRSFVTAQVIFHRFSDRKESLDKLSQLQPIARAIFPDIIDDVVATERLAKDVQFAAMEYAEDAWDDDELAGAARRKIFGTYSENDPISVELNELKARVESALIPVISA